MLVDTTGIGIFRIGRLWNDGDAMMIQTGYQMDGFCDTIGHHDGMRRNAQFAGYQALQLLRLWLRIVIDELETIHQMCFQRRMVSMLPNRGAEIHLHQIVIAVYVVSVPVRHFLT